jgi:hypothetical protein
MLNLDSALLRPPFLQAALMRFPEKQQHASRSGASLQAIVLFLLACTAALAASPLHAAQGTARHLTVLEGKLVSVPGEGPVLRIHEKDQPLSATTTYLFHTLLDKRLGNREVRLEGTMKADGTFEVERLYTVRNGKLYRVRYFCKVCNIEAVEPGDCVCCQQPTELQEILVDDSTR